MAQKTSVVTPERFKKGFSYKDYIAQINVNKDRFEQYLQTASVAPQDAEFLRKVAKMPNGPAKMLVLAEDWCPDVYLGLPMLHRIAETAGMELRIFPRDLNLDIMDEFLKDGEFKSIPTAVFYTKDHQYICHWIERAAVATQEMTEIREATRREMAGADDQAIRTAITQRTNSRRPGWQQEAMKEIRKMLAEKLGL